MLIIQNRIPRKLNNKIQTEICKSLTDGHLNKDGNVGVYVLGGWINRWMSTWIER